MLPINCSSSFSLLSQTQTPTHSYRQPNAQNMGFEILWKKKNPTPKQRYYRGFAVYSYSKTSKLPVHIGIYTFSVSHSYQNLDSYLYQFIQNQWVFEYSLNWFDKNRTHIKARNLITQSFKSLIKQTLYFFNWLVLWKKERTLYGVLILQWYRMCAGTILRLTKEHTTHEE